MQYTTGTVTVTEGSQEVNGVNTEWLNRISPGHIFKISTSRTFYYVGAVLSNTKLLLTEQYGQMTISGITYSITRDFTPNRKYPELRIGDKDPAAIITQALNMIDADILSLRSIMFVEPEEEDRIAVSEVPVFSLAPTYEADKFTCIPPAQTIYITESKTFFYGGHVETDTVSITESKTVTVA